MELNLFTHISALFDKLSEKIDSLVKDKKPRARAFMTDRLDQLGIALCKAQSEMPIAELNKNNPYFKSSYADFTSIVATSRPALTKFGLSVSQVLLDEESGAWIVTTLLHGESNQWICSRKRITPAKNDIQTISSYTTYLKRMCYASLIGVVAGDDDDGERAVSDSRDTFAKGVAIGTKYDPSESSAQVVSNEQLDELEYELQGFGDIAKMVLEGLKIQNLADVPKSKYMAAITRIREIKALRNKGPRK